MTQEEWVVRVYDWDLEELGTLDAHGNLSRDPFVFTEYEEAKAAKRLYRAKGAENRKHWADIQRL